MERVEYSNERFRLSLALVVSVLVHSLLVLITIWAPITRRAASVEPEDQTITFNFAPPVEEAVEENLIGTSPAPRPEPSFRPSGLPSLIPPSEPGDAPLDLSPEPPIEQPAEVESSTKRPEEPADHEDAEREAEQLAAQPSSELPEADDAPTFSGDASDASVEEVGPEGSPRQLELDRAVRDFGRAVERAREARPPSDAGSTQRNVFVPDPTSFPASGVGIGNLEFQSRDYDWSDYARQIYWEILRAWYRRIHHTVADFEKWAFSNSWFLNNRNKIRFTIQRNGQVTGIELMAPSGCRPLDDSALDALAEVILPRLPEDFPRDQETIHATFIATGPIRGMKSHFDYLKRAGVF